MKSYLYTIKLINKFLIEYLINKKIDIKIFMYI